MIELLIALFWGVCSGTQPMDAVPLDWNRNTGWHYESGAPVHGAVADYGFHEIEGGHIRILHRYGRVDHWLIFGTNQPVVENDDGHVQCGGYVWQGD